MYDGNFVFHYPSPVSSPQEGRGKKFEDGVQFMDRKNHVKQDEWRYTTSKTAARSRVKRARSKAKRQLAKKILDEEQP